MDFSSCLAFLPSGQEWIYIGIIFIILFGAEKLPELARGLGRTLGEFKRAKEEMEEELRRATEEGHSPRIRPRDDDDDAIARAPKTLPVTAPSSPTAAQLEFEDLPMGAGDTSVTAPSATADSAAVTSATPATATVATAATALAVAPEASPAATASAVTTPVLRPVTSAVAFGSAPRSAATEVAADAGDDFAMPTTQLDDTGNPVSPYQDKVEAAETESGRAPAQTQHQNAQDPHPHSVDDENDTNRRPSSFVL